MPIEQSGNVTPGHVAIFVTDDVIADGGPLVGTSERVLASLLAADFNTTGDQAIALPSTINKFQLTRIIITNTTLSLTTAVGGFYPSAGKGGTQIVANSQIYSTLTAASKLLNPTLTSFTNTTAFDPTTLTDWVIYFALTTPQGAAVHADIFLVGIDLTT